MIFHKISRRFIGRKKKTTLHKQKVFHIWISYPWLCSQSSFTWPRFLADTKLNLKSDINVNIFPDDSLRSLTNIHECQLVIIIHYITCTIKCCCWRC